MYLGKLEHGKVIRRLRMERNLSIEEVAERIEVDVKFLHELENEMYPDISIGIFFYLAEVFNMEVPDLFEEIYDENIDYFNRNRRHKRTRIKEIKQRDKQRKQALQKKITNNFKNKHTKHTFKRKINNNNPTPTTIIMKLNEIYDKC